MVVIVLVFLLAGCSKPAEQQDFKTKYPDVPSYGIVFDLQKEEEKWKQKK